MHPLGFIALRYFNELTCKVATKAQFAREYFITLRLAVSLRLLMIIDLSELLVELEVLDLENQTRELEILYKKIVTRPSVSSYSSTF